MKGAGTTQVSKYLILSEGSIVYIRKLGVLKFHI